MLKAFETVGNSDGQRPSWDICCGSLSPENTASGRKILTKNSWHSDWHSFFDRCKYDSQPIGGMNLRSEFMGAGPQVNETRGHLISPLIRSCPTGPLHIMPVDGIRHLMDLSGSSFSGRGHDHRSISSSTSLELVTV
jgi:hypothetical protein